MLFAVFRHVNAHHGFFIIEHEPGQRLGQLGLANAGGADKDKGANRPGWVFQTRAGAPDGIRDGMDGFILADDALVQALFHVQQFIGFALHHLAERDAGPLVHHLGNIIHIHHLVQVVFRFPLVPFGGEILFQTQAFGLFLGGAFIVTFHAGLFLFGPQLVNLVLLFLQFLG